MKLTQFRNYAESIFTKYETRMWRKEKTPFLEHSQLAFQKLGYDQIETQEIRNMMGVKSRNLIIGKPDAEVLITAHYDTPGANGGILFLLNPFLGAAIGSTLMMALLIIPDFFIEPESPLWLDIIGWITWGIAIFVTACFFIKNKHNHNDNTSGVLGVYAVAERIAQIPELREKVAFVLFDHEEILPGLLGARAFAKWRRKTYPHTTNGTVINLDCIGVGSVMTVMTKKNHQGWHELAAFMDAKGYETKKAKGSLFGTSDHAVFRNGVSILFQERSKLGPLYIPNIHTRKDKVCDLDKIEQLSGDIIDYIGT